MERDRTMGKDSMVNFGMHDSSSEEWPQNSGNNGGNGNKRTCPMCKMNILRHYGLVMKTKISEQEMASDERNEEVPLHDNDEMDNPNT